MARRVTKMAGTTTFNTYAYLRCAAMSLAQTAKEHPPGSNHCRIASVLFATFTIEAYLNHIGGEKVPSWKTIERGLKWQEKLEMVAKRLGIKIDYGIHPFNVLKGLFTFRNKLGHGKTDTFDSTYYYVEGSSDKARRSDPKWLTRYWKDGAVANVLRHTQKIMKIFHDKASPGSLLGLVSHGEFHGKEEEV